MHVYFFLSLLAFALSAKIEHFAHPFAGTKLVIDCPMPTEPADLGSVLAYGALAVSGLLAGWHYHLDRKRWEQEKKMWADAAAEDQKSMCTT
jgi:hypothetical protein